MTVVPLYSTNPKVEVEEEAGLEVEVEVDLEVEVVEEEGEGVEVELQLVWVGSSTEACQSCAPLEMTLVVSDLQFCHPVLVALVLGPSEEHMAPPLVHLCNAVNLLTPLAHG